MFILMLVREAYDSNSRTGLYCTLVRDEDSNKKNHAGVLLQEWLHLLNLFPAVSLLLVAWLLPAVSCCLTTRIITVDSRFCLIRKQAVLVSAAATKLLRTQQCICSMY